MGAILNLCSIDDITTQQKGTRSSHKHFRSFINVLPMGCCESLSPRTRAGCSGPAGTGLEYHLEDVAVTQHTTAFCSTQVVDMTFMEYHSTNITSLRIAHQKHLRFHK